LDFIFYLKAAFDCKKWGTKNVRGEGVEGRRALWD
jgi:hypothetical protein